MNRPHSPPSQLGNTAIKRFSSMMGFHGKNGASKLCVLSAYKHTYLYTLSHWSRTAQEVRTGCWVLHCLTICTFTESQQCMLILFNHEFGRATSDTKQDPLWRTWEQPTTLVLYYSNTKHTATLESVSLVWLKRKNCFCLLVLF